MGCHTWFYKRSHRTREEAYEIVTSILKEEIKLTNSLLRGKIDWYVPGSDIEQDEQNRKYVEITLRKLRRVESGLCERAVYNHQPEINVVQDGNFYIVINTYHDLFRTKYNNTILTSYDETVEYIKDNNITEVNTSKLIEFWYDYPDGVISFG